jgi:hypothetical protein
MPQLWYNVTNYGRFEVTNKTYVPPSGDRHDYVSFGPYWYPREDAPCLNDPDLEAHSKAHADVCVMGGRGRGRRSVALLLVLPWLLKKGNCKYYRTRQFFLCGALVSSELLACGMLPQACTAFISSPFHRQRCTDRLAASRQCIKNASYNVTSNQAARLEARIKAACGELSGDSAWVRCDGLFNKEFLRGMSG